MIKYVIKTGSSFLNKKARIQRDSIFKKKLRGMHCRKCNTDTIIEFVESDLTHVKHNMYSCCESFKHRIKEKLWSNKSS